MPISSSTSQARLAGVLAGESHADRSYFHVLEHGQLAEQADGLKGTRQAGMRHLVGLLIGDLLPVDKDLSASRGQQAGDDVDQGGLAGPIGADQPEDLTARQRKAHPVQGAQAGKVFGQVPDGQAPVVGTCGWDVRSHGIGLFPGSCWQKFSDISFSFLPDRRKRFCCAEGE